MGFYVGNPHVHDQCGVSSYRIYKAASSPGDGCSGYLSGVLEQVCATCARWAHKSPSTEGIGCYYMSTMVFVSVLIFSTNILLSRVGYTRQEITLYVMY